MVMAERHCKGDDLGYYPAQTAHSFRQVCERRVCRQLCEEVAKSGAAVASAPAHRHAKERLALRRLGFDQLEPVSAKSKGSALGDNEIPLGGCAFDDVEQAMARIDMRVSAQLQGAKGSDGAWIGQGRMAAFREYLRVLSDGRRQRGIVVEQGARVAAGVNAIEEPWRREGRHLIQRKSAPGQSADALQVSGESGSRLPRCAAGKYPDDADIGEFKAGLI